MRIPAKSEKIAVFCYKALAWMILGVAIGSFVALLQGFLPVWFTVVFVLSLVGLGMVFIQLFFKYIDNKQVQLMHEAAQGRIDLVPARIDSVQFGGVRFMEKRELLYIQITVFPPHSSPYQTIIRQVLSLTEQEELEHGKLVMFYENHHNPGYGTILLRKAGVLPAEMASTQASKRYPLQGSALWFPLGSAYSKGVLKWVSVAMAVCLFGVGFISPYMATGNTDWFVLRMKYFPQKLTFDNKGNFNEELLRKSFDKAVEYIDGRKVVSLLFYKDFTEAQIRQAVDSERMLRAVIRGNSVSARRMLGANFDEEDQFDVDEIRYEVMEKALDDLAKEYDVSDIMYMGFRKDIRWHLPVEQRTDFMDLHIVMEGGKTSFLYDGKTGKRLPKRR